MAWAVQVDGRWSRLEGGFTLGEVRYPSNWLEVASAAEKSALGIREITPALEPLLPPQDGPEPG